MFLFLGKSHIQIVILCPNYTYWFHKSSIKRFLHHKKCKISYTHCYLKHNFYRLNMFCACHHCKQRFLVLLSRLFLSMHQAGLSLARSCRSGHHPLSLIPLPRCPQNGDCLHAIPSGSVRLMLSVLNVDHEIINAIIL